MFKVLIVSWFFLGSIAVSVNVSAELRVNVSNNLLTFYGEQFGEGAHVELYDDFESEYVPRLGRWQSSEVISRARTTEYVANGSYAMEGFSSDTGRARIHRLQFDKPIQEVFLSYKVRIGYGESFPARTAEDFGVFPHDSSWKFAWLIDEDTSGNNADLALPTYVGSGGIFLLAGNSNNLERIRNTSDWWSWEGWIRISVHLKPNSQDPLLPGNAFFQAESNEKGFFKQSYVVPIFRDNGHYPKQFQKLNIPGWIRVNSDTAVFYDDIYVASGEASQARIEVGSHPVYQDNSDLTILPVKIWENEKIVVELTNAEKDEYIDKYAFIFNADGDIVGSPIMISGNPPKPVELKVL